MPCTCVEPTLLQERNKLLTHRSCGRGNNNNIYTRALNERGGFVARAKVVRREGEIQYLYISDARPLSGDSA